MSNNPQSGDANIEINWDKAFKMAEVHYKLREMSIDEVFYSCTGQACIKCHSIITSPSLPLSSMDPSNLKLTKLDDTIHQEFQKSFPNFNLSLLNEDSFKSEERKAAWDSFINHFIEGKVVGYDTGCLLRKNCSRKYDKDNVILVQRYQYLAIEIARNREGLNDEVYQKAQREKAKAAKTKKPGCGGCC